MNWLSHPFHSNFQDTFISKPYELGTWNVERIFASLQVSHVTCHMLYVICHMSHVKCHIYVNIYFFLGGGDKVVEVFGWGFNINGAYPL